MTVCTACGALLVFVEHKGKLGFRAAAAKDVAHLKAEPGVWSVIQKARAEYRRKRREKAAALRLV